eukprot:scaffold19663_cov90-Isochrysis_galbana.AAC.1
MQPKPQLFAERHQRVADGAHQQHRTQIHARSGHFSGQHPAPHPRLCLQHRWLVPKRSELPRRSQPGHPPTHNEYAERGGRPSVPGQRDGQAELSPRVVVDPTQPAERVEYRGEGRGAPDAGKARGADVAGGPRNREPARRPAPGPEEQQQVAERQGSAGGVCEGSPEIECTLGRRQLPPRKPCVQSRVLQGGNVAGGHELGHGSVGRLGGGRQPHDPILRHLAPAGAAAAAAGRAVPQTTVPAVGERGGHRQRRQRPPLAATVRLALYVHGQVQPRHHVLDRAAAVLLCVLGRSPPAAAAAVVREAVRAEGLSAAHRVPALRLRVEPLALAAAPRHAREASPLG